MSEVRKCDDRFYEGEQCPICGEVGDMVIDHDKRRKASKFLSGLLRHFPDDYDVNLDTRGWVSTGEVLEACSDKYDWIDSEQVLAIVATDNKGRFEVDGYSIRASYGHSVDDVELEENNTVVPNVLYHGTDGENVESIMEEGLKPMNRNMVHMTDSADEALEVGRRHTSDPTLLEIDAESMMNDGLTIVKRGKVVYTSDHVPSEYISVQD